MNTYKVEIPDQVGDDRKEKMILLKCFFALGICAYFHCEIGALMIPTLLLAWLIFKYNREGQEK